MKRKSLIVAFLIVFIDQLVKLSIDNSFLLGESNIIIKGFFNITKVYNYGASWSMFSGMINFLIVISLCSFIVLIYYQEFFKKNFRNVLAFGLIYGGLFGNLIDRLSRSHVIDYFDFKIFNYNFPVFNIADIALVVGFILLLIAVMKGEDKHGNKSRTTKHKA
ncbi:MAG: signal peptidase II [Bacilli bacterium]